MFNSRADGTVRPVNRKTIAKDLYDNMTGLPGRSAFFQMAEEERKHLKKEGDCPAFLFVNPIGMKYYNRRHGFKEGDDYLRLLARLLSSHFGNENCAHYGMDHFGVLTVEKDLEEKLDRLIADVAKLKNGKTLPVRIGIYLDKTEGVDLTIICDRTKIACDEMKTSRSSCYNYYDESVQEDEKKQQYIISHLDRAIEEGWIQVYFQPIVRAVNGRVCDEEALARWIDPTYGFLSPADFIPVLENAELIYKLDLHMLDLILGKIKKHEEIGLTVIPQSLNLSRADFNSCDIVEEICKRVDAAGIRHDLLSVEITESIIGSDFEFMKEQVERFRSLGFPVWMDDFGSGYSSLDVLQEIPFDLIKFDMHFLKNLDQGNNGKIILTELVKMTTALGVDSVCEGVETESQVEFLQEIGCSKLQGYYYSKPIPLEEVFRRQLNRKEQLGYENPEESDYFDAVGRINLYDLSIIADESSDFSNYFNTLPMGIVEMKGNSMRLVRCNPSYQEFMERAFGRKMTEEIHEFTDSPYGVSDSFKEKIKQCCQTGNRLLMNDMVLDTTLVHSFFRKIAENPVTGTFSVAVAILSMTDVSQDATYERIAKAMTADYFNIFYVNLDTENFVEYTSSAGEEELAVERHGESFFAASAKDAKKLIYQEDQENFLQVFTKENVIRALDEQGVFTVTYRLDNNGDPIYVLMKGIRMHKNSSDILIGVSNIDAQMKEKAAVDRLRQEQLIYTRLTALSEQYLVLYTVDLNTEHFIEYNASGNYRGLGLAEEGDDFFEVSRTEAERVICPDDLEEYFRCFTKEVILEKIEKYGKFVFKYHLILEGKPVPVCMRAARVEESDGAKLIVGVSTLEEDIEED